MDNTSYSICAFLVGCKRHVYVAALYSLLFDHNGEERDLRVVGIDFSANHCKNITRKCYVLIFMLTHKTKVVKQN